MPFLKISEGNTFQWYVTDLSHGDYLHVYPELSIFSKNQLLTFNPLMQNFSNSSKSHKISTY